MKIKLDKKTWRVIVLPQPASEHNRKSAPVSAYKMRDERRRMETLQGMGNAWYSQMGGYAQATNPCRNLIQTDYPSMFNTLFPTWRLF